MTRAQSTVARAVRLDIARGRLQDAFRRLVAVGAEQDVADLLSRHGVALVLGRMSRVELAGFARSHPQVVDDRPDTWFPLALERWILDDVEAAQHWSERILERVGREPDLADRSLVIDPVRLPARESPPRPRAEVPAAPGRWPPAARWPHRRRGCGGSRTPS